MNNRHIREKADELWFLLDALKMLKLEIIEHDIEDWSNRYWALKDDNGKITGIDTDPEFGYLISISSDEKDRIYSFPRWRFYEFIVNYTRAYASDEIKKEILHCLNMIGIYLKEPIDLQMSKPLEREYEDQYAI